MTPTVLLVVTAVAAAVVAAAAVVVRACWRTGSAPWRGRAAIAGTSRPVPLLGGLAIALGAGAAIVPAVGPTSPRPRLVAGGARVRRCSGLIDDLRPLKPQTKLTAQLVVATAVVSVGLRLPVTGIVWCDMLLSLLWLVALTNAFNLLDNMDGLAAGVAAIAALRHGAAVCQHRRDGRRRGSSAAVGGACAGFLVHNCHPASIFMGDAGSLFLGFMIGGLGLRLGGDGPARLSVAGAAGAGRAGADLRHAPS